MIYYNKIGLIKSGDMKDFFVKVINDTENTGGYYILYSRDFSDKTAEGYDDWFLIEEDVEKYLETITVDWNV